MITLHTHQKTCTSLQITRYITYPTLWYFFQECVAARFAQSLVLGAYSHQNDPDNEYLLITAAKGWKILQDFWNTPKNEVIARWKEIVHSYNNQCA